VLVIGIGPGDPDLLTVAAVRALNETDAVFIVDKGDAAAELQKARRELCERVIERDHPYRFTEVELDAVRDRGEGSYGEAIAGWRDARVDAYEQLVAGLGPDETGAFLVWGDPSLYDGTVAILRDVQARGAVELSVEVVAGISSIAALAARHGVALNRASESILITTGRRLAKDGIPPTVDNIVVMLDAHDAWQTLDDDFDVWWAAFVGMSEERIVGGRLGEQREAIDRERTRLRADRGWLFDTFLFRRPQ
jgi:precorrin-6A synthase